MKRKGKKSATRHKRRAKKICRKCGAEMQWVPTGHHDMTGKAQGYWLCLNCAGE